ncbi:MAG: Rrf2 family transcriptional regulator [Bacteroidota bacterium]
MNSQLAIGLHILGFLASRPGERLTSEQMARTYGTSPVVLRRVLAKLRQRGLVETWRGNGGGSALARSAKEITLREAYEAIAEDQPILTRHPSDCAGRVATVMGGYINELYADAELALLRRLEAVTVAEMDQEIRTRLFGSA